MKIANGIEMMEIQINSMGRKTIIYPTLMWDNETVILVDAGMANSLPQIKIAIEDAGVPFEKLNMIIVTHQDIDHIGGIKEILTELPQVKVLAHEEDKPYIQGEKKLIRLNSKFMNRINEFPEKERNNILKMFENTSVQINRTLNDGEKLNYCGGITVIHTPGHTPGHICLYHNQSKTMIVGDAMNIIDGELVGPNKQIISEDEAKRAMMSLKKFENFDIEKVISYHGGFFDDNPNQKIRELL
jgi:glyoxylase-like metal-dependent hydrolase (beta-lactamase superfamily II)